VNELRGWAHEVFRLGDVFDQQDDEVRGWVVDDATQLLRPCDSLEVKGIGRLHAFYAASGSDAAAIKLFKKHVAISDAIDLTNPHNLIMLWLVEVVTDNLADAYQVISKVAGTLDVTKVDKSTTCMLGVWVCNKVPFTPIKVVPSENVQELEDYLLTEFPSLQTESQDECQKFVPIAERRNGPDEWSLKNAMKIGGSYEFQVPTTKVEGCLEAKKKIETFMPHVFRSVCFHNYVSFFIVRCEDGLIPSGIQSLHDEGVLV